MQNKKFSLFLSSLLLVLFVFSCTTEPVNVATSFDGVNVAFYQQGKGKPAVIFIHGWANPKEIWDDQVDHFSQKYKTIAIDLYSPDESRNKRSDWTMEAFGKDVVSVINKLKLKEAVLVGFSMGTAVAIEATKQVPEKVIGVVLVDDLLDPDVKYPPEVIAFMDSVMMDLVNDMTNEKLIMYGFYKNNPDVHFQRLLDIYPDSVSQTGWNESLLGYFDWINEDLTESLKQLSVPVIAINSDMELTNIEVWKAYVPSFQAKIMTDVGHLVFWENPDEFNRLLEESIQEFMKE